MRKQLFVSVLALTCAPAMAWAGCTNPTSLSNGTTSNSVQNAVLSNSPNYGYYTWSDAANAWILAEQSWDYFAEAEYFAEGDYVIPRVEFPARGSRPPGGLPPTQPKSIGGNANLQSLDCDPVDMPKITVTAPRPSTGGSWSMIIYRPNNFVNVNRGDGFARREAGTGVKQADQKITCNNSSDNERGLAALHALRTSILPRGIYLIRYAPGNFQLWSITSPLASDRGLQPVGKCVSRQ